MVRHHGSKEITTRKQPNRAFSFVTLGARTKGWDKNPPPRDCPYGTFGKRVQRSLLGFGSLATAIYSRKLISQVTLNESHGILEPGKSNMRYFHERLEYHRGEETTEFKTMCQAVEALFTRFPDIRQDVTRSGQDAKPLITKLRKVMKGAHAARNADANMIRREIFTLSHGDAEKRGWSMPVTLEKNGRGIKSEATARFFLPLAEREIYMDDPAAYCEKVQRNEIKLSLSGTWSAILYDEDSLNKKDELCGLFRSETLLRCGIAILCGPSAGRHWRYPEPGARSFASSQKESNAEINGITEITPEAIAYFSTLVIFAVHDSEYFSRDMDGIDLSDVYHDVVAALNMDLKWATDTLAFWNKIFFGDREVEAAAPRPNRKDRFQRLEQTRRREEGLPDLGTRTPRQQVPPATTPGHRRQDAQRSCEDFSDSEDEDTRRSQGSSHSRRPENRQKRKMSIPPSESDDPRGDETDTAEPPRPKIIRRHDSSISTGLNQNAPRPTTNAKEKQVVNTSSESCFIYVDTNGWEDVRKDIAKTIEQAAVAGLSHIHTQFTRLYGRDTEKGVHSYNTNYDKWEYWRKKVEKQYEAVQAARELERAVENEGTTQEHVPRENQESTSRPSNPQAKGLKSKKPATKKTAASKPRKGPRANNETMQPPRVTRSVTAQLSSSRKRIRDDDLDPFDLDEPISPTREPAPARTDDHY